MIETYLKGLTQLIPAAPATVDETERRPSLVEAMVLQRCELVSSGQHKGTRPDDPPDLLRCLVNA